MDHLFGVSMDLIMWVLLALLAASLSTLLYVAVFNRIMFKLGIRNIPRRPAQTALIVIGLMLSTVIIAAAFTTGDTVDRSITGEVYSILGSVDEVIQMRGGRDDSAFDDPNEAAVRDASFQATSVAPLLQNLRSNPLVDAAVPIYSDFAVAVNLQARQSSPLFTVLGLDPTAARDLPDIENVKGGHVRVEELAPGEIYVDKSAADELAINEGDSVQIITNGKSASFRVRAIVRDRRLAGAGGVSVRREGGVLPLAIAQQLFDAPGQLTSIAVSNAGDARSGLKHTDAVTDEIEASIRSLRSSNPELPPLAVQTTKRIGVNIAQQGANLFTTFFLVLGLFSIGAGVLLIFMIFVMLAAERKSEMGMARAVGTKRMDLVQTFLSEGMAYNVLAAMVGTGIGVLVAFAMSRVMASIFSQFDINISPYVTPRSLIISYALGVVLTFFTVTFSSWRVSQINIVRAIRDIPEPPTPRPMWRAHGIFSTLGGLVFKSGSRKSWAIRAGLIVLGAVLIGGSGGAGSDGVRILLSTLGGLSILMFVFFTFKTGFLFVIGSLPLIAIGTSSDQAFPLLFGLSLLPLGLALILRSFGANERATYTTAGLILLYVWEFDFSVGLIERIFGKTNGNIEMFFLSGVMVTVAATFLVVYNSDLILGPLTRLGSGLGALLPSLKMAVAYPLANRTRTGLTMAMFCLVVFALTVMSSMNHNFNRLFISDRALGGWDVTVDENPTNLIGDLKAQLAAAGSPALSKIQAIGVSSLVSRRRAVLCQVTETTRCDPADLARAGLNQSEQTKAGFYDYQVRGEDGSFLSTAQVALQSRAPGYADDEAVWRAIGADPTLSIIDSFALASSGGFGNSGFIKGVDPQSREMQPLTLVVGDRSTGKIETLKVIGVVELGSSASYSGLHVSQPTLERIFVKPDLHRFFVKTVPGTDNREAAREIESTLLTTGAQAESLRYQVDKQNSTFNGFFLLMQGFMGLGLFVGVAAVGVIAFRTVVERRQQIGMLRALGYTKGMIGLTFVIESSFIAFMGVLSGVVFAVILARQLITQEFANQGVNSFSVPWPQVLGISAAAFGFALLMTLIPSRQAASIPIAQALRYE